MPSLWSRLFGRPDPTPSDPAPSETKAAVDFASAPSLGYSLGLFPSSTGVPVTPQSSLQVTAVYACVRALADDIAALPIRVRRVQAGGGAVADPKHPVARLLRAPNGWQTPYELLNHMIVSLTLRGNAYLYINRAPDGTPVQLIPLLPDRVMVVMNEGNGSLFYNISSPMISERVLTVPGEDIVHVRNISLDGGILGLSPLAAAQESVGLAQATQKHAAVMFRQGTLLRGILSTDGKLSAEAATNLRASWEKTYEGNDNAHKIAVLEDNLKFQPLSMTASDSELLASRRFSVEEIARLFRVPLSKIGATGTNTIANIETEEQGYISYSLLPLCRRIEEAFEQRLLFEDERDRIEIRFDFEGMLRANTKDRFAAAQIGLLNGFLSINEVRAREGMTPVEGGDNYRIPLNTAALESSSAIGAAMTTPTPPKAPKPGQEVLSDEKPEGPDEDEDDAS